MVSLAVMGCEFFTVFVFFCWMFSFPLDLDAMGVVVYSEKDVDVCTSGFAERASERASVIA